VGAAAFALTEPNTPITVEGAGADIWGASDSFQFLDVGVGGGVATFRVVSLQALQAFAKAGLMWRDGLAPNAPSVIVDAKPDGGVEFMARACVGCATTYLGGAQIAFPAYLILSKSGSTYEARVAQSDPAAATTIGSVVIQMSTPTFGLAVTSHDVNHIATAIFDTPPR
jgi:hypothetical protein